MTIKQLLFELEKWIPPQISWQKDNVGLQTGNPQSKLKNILLSLDLDLEIVKEAKLKSANLIISHHPLFFNLPKNITPQTLQGKIATELIQNNICSYAAHTNLDSVHGGVNTTIANLLGLKEISILTPLENKLCKFIVYVPEKYLEEVANSIHSAGGGMFLKYDKCSFRSKGIGTFRGDENSKPAIGKQNKLESVDEYKLEVLTEDWKISEILKTVRKVHPYEEVAYDVIPLENKHHYFGLGAIGNLKNKLSKENFLKFVKNKLISKSLRYSGDIKKIERVAICGGSGSKYILNAIQNGADAFITSDLSYHIFQDYSDKILLIDAGHYETENHVLKSLKKKLDEVIKSKNSSTKVFISNKMKNPISYF
ncbi:MAG: Nif3-like dinuclear metal center hexameric protein [Bacteroidetes bacterium]|nr:Nif3-like dinuclear metal center hexameric protein [Bacteroidota bacterium]